MLIPRAHYNKKGAELAATVYYQIGNAGDNHNANAFKHAVWSGFNAMYWGANNARALGQAHETGPGDPNQHTMDLFNNELGITIGVNAINEQGVVSNALTAIANGEGRRLAGSQNNGAVIPTDGSGRN